MIYGYDDLLKDISNNFFSIGKSLYNRDILAVKTGCGVPRAIIVSGTHARESITSAVCVEYIKNCNLPLVFVPMLNPDGVMLVKEGIKSVPKKYRKKVLYINNGSNDFRLWKANGRGVDINVNFDADFGLGKENVKNPAPQNYIGQKESEPETQAIINFILENKFNALISLHSKGDLIYYGFKNCKSYVNYVKMVSEEINMPYFESAGSAGGLKDWFLQKDLGFAITVEMGDDGLSHPFDTSECYGIYNRTKNLPSLLYNISEDLWKKSLCCVP